MKKTACWAAQLLLVFSAARYGRAEELDDLKAEWRAVNAAPSAAAFDRLLPKLLAYRARAGAKGWELNYMLGTSFCHVPGKEENGKVALYRVLGSYGVPPAGLEAAQNALTACGERRSAAPELTVNVGLVSAQMGATLRGKGGFEVDPGAGSTTRKLEVSPVPVANLRKFLFRPDQANAAVSAAIARTKDPQVRGRFRDGFVVTTASGELPPEETARCLAPYRDILVRQFGMAAPRALITTYVVEPEELPRYAARLHGVMLPLGVVAYSVYEDLSIVGVASMDACGSLAHELVHLLIRQNFGDSPAWLEEGLASEVAVANRPESTFHFPRSWRDETLSRYWNQRPKVAELLKARWTSYYTSEMGEVNRVAALHGMAAAFIRYLDAKGKLVPVYTAMRDALSGDGALTDEAILEKSLGRSVAEVDEDFVTWFGRK